MLQGWFFIQGNVGAWLADMLKGKHAHVLNGITIDQNLSGKAVAWCPEPLNADGVSMYAPPIDQGIHVPFHSPKPVQGLFIIPTVKFLTLKLAEQTALTQNMEEQAIQASGSGDTVGATQAGQEAVEQQDGEEEVQERPSRRRRTDCAVYEPVNIDEHLFPDGKYRGKYADAGDGDL